MLYKLESDLLQSLEFRESAWSMCSEVKRPLEGKPSVSQTVGSSGSFLWQELQHRKQEISEGLGLLTRPLVFIHQNLQQTPRLQFSDVLQVTYRKHTIKSPGLPIPCGLALYFFYMFIMFFCFFLCLVTFIINKHIAP